MDNVNLKGKIWKWKVLFSPNN